MNPFERLPYHEVLWQQLTHRKNNIQALLLQGPAHANIDRLIQSYAAWHLCKSQNVPCGICSFCRMVSANTHPDVCWIKPETDQANIKIEQIRDLQSSIYQAPQCAAMRIIVISPMDALNHASANALLKLLEEPPPSCLFVLAVENLALLAPTIISRCQMYVVPSLWPEDEHLSLGAYYQEPSTRAVLYQKRLELLTSMGDYLQHKKTVCHLASEWSVYALMDLLWFLYLVTSQLIEWSLLDKTPSHDLYFYSKSWHPLVLFKQLDKILSLQQQIQQGMTPNVALVLETLLLGFME